MLKMLLAAAVVMAAPVVAQPKKMLSFEDGADSIAMFRKVQCSTQDGVQAVYHWSGRVWSRVPGEPDRLLWRVEGMNIRHCVTTPAIDKRGPGMRLISRELMFYLDPKTGEVVDKWTNPWTGKVNEMFHVANDPVNQRPMYAVNAEGRPFSLNARAENGRVFLASEIPLFYKNPLAGDYQDYVGNHYHAMEIFDFNMDEKELRDPRTTTSNAAIAWVRVSDWLPFMEMGSRAGGLIFNATGQKVDGIKGLPAVVQKMIAERYPAYASPPPLDDARPNATTWTEYKKLLDSRRANGAGAPPAKGE
ncbi:DUF1838 family protein [Sandaracinobacteroides saxicola]|uniref:DUF1838 family protein n=1 Tax=Sandaracinobacteroides saxicola TaxID=2759707 RepID=A0A7G5ILC2_9SPHN|nr:DUF1838 family protein [Sandaracinobacteroides saxicola]QMW24164.1 DUF1838 family protein [Sandaracinobacteroides saxicola]